MNENVPFFGRHLSSIRRKSLRRRTGAPEPTTQPQETVFKLSVYLQFPTETVQSLLKFQNGNKHMPLLTVLVAPIPVGSTHDFYALEDSFKDYPGQVLPRCQAHSESRKETKHLTQLDRRSPIAGVREPGYVRGRGQKAVTVGGHTASWKKHVLAFTFYVLFVAMTGHFFKVK